MVNKKTTNELVGKVYGDYNALAINMGVGCDCDPEVKQAIQMDWIGCPKPDNAKNFEQDHNESYRFYCEVRGCKVTYRRTCKHCIVASADNEGNFYCPFRKKQ